jgi:SpoIIAA-like
MPVTWQFRGAVLVLAVSGVVTNQEIEVTIGEAVASAPCQRGMRLLWDARKSQTPISSLDMVWRFELLASLGERGVFSRGALLLRQEQRQLLELGRLETSKALRTLESYVFTDESEALAWLER